MGGHPSARSVMYLSPSIYIFRMIYNSVAPIFSLIMPFAYTSFIVTYVRPRSIFHRDLKQWDKGSLKFQILGLDQ
jgi:hypothetical protein